MTEGRALLADLDVEALNLEKSKAVSLKNIFRLSKRIAIENADLVCTYNFGSIEAVIANRLGPGLPHVHHEDGFAADEAGGRHKRRRIVARRLLLTKSMVAIPSKTLEKIALEQWRIDPLRLRRIAVGVDLARFRRGERMLGEPIVVGSIGALRPEKNHARLIRCFEAAAKGRNARLVICGEGPERAQLAIRAAGSEIAASISLPGAVARPEEAMADFDIFALSSDTEQMPTSLIEAMAAGLPTVATDVGDVREMVSGAAREFVVPAESERAFEGALRRLIDDGALRTALGAANAERSRVFGQDKMTENFRALYLGALKAGR